MGEGPNPKNTQLVSSKKSPRVEVEEPVGDAGAGGGASTAVAEPEIHPCASPRISPFLAATPVAVADLVEVSGGSPPEVRIGSRRIGVLIGPEAKAVEACLRFGYRFSGLVDSFDVVTLTGTIAISGRK